MGIFTKAKQEEPKKETLSAVGVAFRLKQPSNIQPTKKAGIWKYDPQS
jgi:hypothetical protein